MGSEPNSIVILFLLCPMLRAQSSMQVKTMITGGRIDAVEGKKNKEDEFKGLNINISVDGVSVTGENVEVSYTYDANYAEGVGFVRVKGAIFAKEDKKLAKEIDDEWKKSKKMPDVFAEGILSAINYTGSANGIFISRVLNLSPPLVPQRIQLGGAMAGTKK